MPAADSNSYTGLRRGADAVNTSVRSAGSQASVIINGSQVLRSLRPLQMCSISASMFSAPPITVGGGRVSDSTTSTDL
ncbi:hypothetical protein [Mycobacterium sp.]|uniref:hypothetical protein n=1 Tax=Mycobacterium sp. TaxID=1785 RepID=UPI0031D8C6DC